MGNGFKTTNDYILGPGGVQLTEMGVGGTSTSGDSTTALTWQHTNIWAGGKLLGTYDGGSTTETVSGTQTVVNTYALHFYFDDPLGTRRAQTDYAGVLEQTCSSLPFGDGLNCTGGNLQSPTEHHFTGKERDTESGNDYFGARYYASTMGRWLSPDWSAKYEPVPYAKLGDPQTLNLYGYVGNNPLSRFDDDGHEVITLQLRSYIPQSSVGPYVGDNRGPTASQNVTSRTSITVTVETDPSVSQNPLIGTPVSTAGQTQNLLTGNTATQTVGLPTATVTHDSNGNVVVGVTQNAANPLTPASVTPGIQSNVTMTVPVNGSSVTTSGTVSGSPAFELNVGTPGNSTTNIPLQGAPSNSIMFGIGLKQTNTLPQTTTPLPAPKCTPGQAGCS